MRRALYDRLSVLRRAELHLRIAEALEAADRPAERAHSRRPRPPFRGGGPDRRGGPGRGVQPPGREGGVGRAGLRRDRGSPAHGSARSGSRTSGGEPRSCSISARRCSAPVGRSRRCRRSARRRRSHVSSATESCSTRAAIGFETTCWRPGLTDEGARELLDEASAALGREDSTLRVGLLAESRSRARVRGRPRPGCGRARGGDRDGAPNRRPVAGWRRCSMGVYWARATTSLAEALEMLGEARDFGRGARRHRGPGRGDRLAGRRTDGPRRDRAAAREELAIALDMAQHTRQPFILHVAEHYRFGAGAARGSPGGGRGGRRALARVGQLLVGRDASGVYGIQMFGVRREQGRLAELAPVIRVLAAGDREAARGAPVSPRCSPSSAMEEQVRGELDRVQAEGLEPLREGLWLASLTYLADAAGAVAHAGSPRLSTRCSRRWPARTS